MLNITVKLRGWRMEQLHDVAACDVGITPEGPVLTVLWPDGSTQNFNINQGSQLTIWSPLDVLDEY
jgi:hypothetical protein